MGIRFTDCDLGAYLDEALPPEEMARIEKAAREDRAVAEQLAAIHSRRASGVHSLGEIWRRHRLSCPSRQELGSYLLGALDEGPASYVAFHIEVVGCRYCQANLADLRAQQAGGDPAAPRRRTKYFRSSAGRLEGKKR